MGACDEDRRSTPTLEIAALPRPHRWALDVQDSERERRVVLPEGRTFVVGSSRTTDLSLVDRAVSGRHCSVSVLGNGVAIADLGSKNGTFVGGARVKEAWAAPGTVVTVGRSTFQCIAVGADADLADPGPPLPGIAGASVGMRRVAAQVRRLAGHVAPVLVAGESGTGKELIARALHQEGPRASRPFIAINVAALPRELVETEMFGHERGAFTGAATRRIGAFAEAEGGTLFLDEIAELPLEAQPKMLRALDGYEIRRVGAAGAGRRTNVRVVAATHSPLEARVATGAFRRDLFHRLEVFLIEIPPLRERRGDIAPIAQRLLAQMEGALGPRTLSSAAIARLVAHAWPGNVRELRNVLYRAADAAAEHGSIDAQHVERGLRAKPGAVRAPLSPELARTILSQHNNNLSAAARSVGYPRSTFRKLTMPWAKESC